MNIDISSSKHEIEVYRKDTFSDNIIPACSKHPLQHKLANFHCLIHRLLSIPLDDFAYQKELSTIKNICINNGYNEKIIEDMLKRKEKQMVCKMVYPNSKVNNKLNIKWKRIPYI